MFSIYWLDEVGIWAGLARELPFISLFITNFMFLLCTGVDLTPSNIGCEILGSFMTGFTFLLLK